MAQTDEDAWGPLSEVEKTVSRVDSWTERRTRAEQPPDTIPNYNSTKRAIWFAILTFAGMAIYSNWDRIVLLYQSYK